MRLAAARTYIAVLDDQATDGEVEQLQQRMVEAYNITVLSQYRYALKGFSFQYATVAAQTVVKQQLVRAATMDLVKFIAPDGIVRAFGTGRHRSAGGISITMPADIVDI